MRYLTAVALVGASMLGGCASIVGGGMHQTVSVETRSDAGPAIGANCKLVNDKGSWFVTTPGTAMVHRSMDDMHISCATKDSQPVGSAVVKSATRPLVFGNILFGGIIGIVIDVANGAAFDYPAMITVMNGTPMPEAPAGTTLPAAAPAAAPAPAVAPGPSGAPSARPLPMRTPTWPPQ